MRNPLGYGILCTEDGQIQEHDTFTCFHCNSIVVVKPLMKPEDLGGMCKVCMKLTCPACTSVGSCTPWEKQMEQIEARDRFLRQCGL